MILHMLRRGGWPHDPPQPGDWAWYLITVRVRCRMGQFRDRGGMGR